MKTDQDWWQFVRTNKRKYLEGTFFYLLGAFFCWLVLAGAYGAGSTPYPESPLYNDPHREIIVAYVHLPIIALLWPLWLYILNQLGEFFDWFMNTNLHNRFHWRNI